MLLAKGWILFQSGRSGSPDLPGNERADYEDSVTGVGFARKVRVEFSTGASITDDSYDPAPFIHRIEGPDRLLAFSFDVRCVRAPFPWVSIRDLDPVSAEGEC